jgi:hypothetical protein
MQVRQFQARKSPPGDSGERSGERLARVPDSPEDREFETALLGLLSNLEFLRTQLDAALAEGRHAEVVETATLLLNQVVAFAEKHFAGADDLTRAQALAGEFFATTSRAKEHLKRPALKSLWRWLGGAPAESAEDRDRLRQLAPALDEVLAAFFTLFTTHFTGEGAARRWKDTQEVFRADLKQVFSRLK